jgi:hypothetical protein
MLVGIGGARRDERSGGGSLGEPGRIGRVSGNGSERGRMWI